MAFPMNGQNGGASPNEVRGPQMPQQPPFKGQDPPAADLQMNDYHPSWARGVTPPFGVLPRGPSQERPQEMPPRWQEHHGFQSAVDTHGRGSPMPQDLGMNGQAQR